MTQSGIAMMAYLAFGLLLCARAAPQTWRETYADRSPFGRWGWLVFCAVSIIYVLTWPAFCIPWRRP